MERRGVGEIFLNSIDRDGSGAGYDIALMRHVTDAVDVPVVACGGVGRYEDFASAVSDGHAAAAAAANIFHFFELSYPRAKQAAVDADSVTRMSELLEILPDKQREILILRVVVGLSAEETAEAVGSTAGAVRVAQHRALARLKSAIAAAGRDYV